MRRGGSSLDVEAARCRRLHGADGARQACVAPHFASFGGGVAWLELRRDSERASRHLSGRQREKARDG